MKIVCEFRPNKNSVKDKLKPSNNIRWLFRQHFIKRETYLLKESQKLKFCETEKKIDENVKEGADFMQ